MHDQLLHDYLLGRLSPNARRRVEAELAADPDLRDRLDALRRALGEPEATEAPAPPPDLLWKTLARVAEHRCKLPTAPQPSRRQVGGASRRWGRPVDWVVAAALLILASGVGLPLLARLWADNKRVECGNNLRSFWVDLQAYADRGQGEFPRVEGRGAQSVAGSFVPVLKGCGLARQPSIGCPANGVRPPLPYTLHELETMQNRDPAAFEVVARALAGDYAYSLGYREGQALRGLRRDAGDGLPIMADTAGHDGEHSPNHGGTGQNVLFVGGHVRWCAQPTVGLEGDHIYVNRHFQVLAGVSRDDTVLAPSGARAQQDGE